VSLMTVSPKVLLLTGSYGNGHLQVTKTIKKTFVKKGINQIVECDLFLDAHPLITNVTKYLYIKSYTYGQKLYGMFYYGGNKKRFYRKIDLMSHYGMRRLMKIVEKEKPDIIVNTFPMLVVPEFRKKTGVKIPIVNVLTDFCLHANWIHDEVDEYYVATEDLKQNMTKKGISQEKIKVTGIPIQPEFEVNHDLSLLFEKYHLHKDKSVILIVAGAFGVLKDMDEIVYQLTKDKDHQIVVVCGKNKKLKARLLDIFQQNSAVHILGYTTEMHELMKMATVLVTKPGGITLSEALAVKVPLLLYRPVPGQERENAHYFEENGACINVKESSELIEQIKNLAADHNLQHSIKSNMEKLHVRNAADLISENIITLLQEEQSENKMGIS
jgi:processive 1,2-diacylglycerol beta-glucosyltransferase